MSIIEMRLKQLEIELPRENPPAANYVPYVKTGNLVFIAGQTCKWDGILQYIGKVGSDYTTDEGRAAARLCGLNIILQLKKSCDGNLDKVKRCVKIGVFVNSNDEFKEHAKIADGVSDLLVDVFGENGRHVRVSASSNSLPSGATVEVDAIFELLP